MPFPGGAALGLYNWGTNRDWTTVPATPMAEEPRTHVVRLADLGLTDGPYHGFEYWTGADLGVLEGGVVTLAVPPRDCRVVVLHGRGPLLRPAPGP